MKEKMKTMLFLYNVPDSDGRVIMPGAVDVEKMNENPFITGATFQEDLDDDGNPIGVSMIFDKDNLPKMVKTPK